MATAVDYLRTIADAVTPGQEGVKFDGALYNRVKETLNTVNRTEALLREGSSKSVYNRLDDIEKYVASIDQQLKALGEAIAQQNK